MLIGLGFAVGIISGFLGVGGGWLITPALISYGLSAIVAIGSDLTYIFGAALIGTLVHRKLGQVDFKIGASMIVGVIAGVELGKIINETVLKSMGIMGSNLFVSVLYVVLLGYLSVFMIKNVRKSQENTKVEKNKKKWSEKLQEVRIPPIISSKMSNVSISFWIILPITFIIGTMVGLMGTGGGFILLPVLIYFIGCPTKIAVGTSLFVIIFSSAYGSFTYSAAGHIQLAVPILLLIGSTIGIQIGAMATTRIKEISIHKFFGIAVALAGVSRALVIPNYLDKLGKIAISPRLQDILSASSVFVIYGTIIFLAMGIIVLALRKRK